MFRVIRSLLWSNTVYPGIAQKMTLVVNVELGMKMGKIAAQTAHGAVGLCHTLNKSNEGKDYLATWLAVGQPKVVLRGQDTEHLLDLQNTAKKFHLPTFLVRDAGRTQVPSGSVTVLAVLGPTDTVDKVTGRLRLL